MSQMRWEDASTAASSRISTNSQCVCVWGVVVALSMSVPTCICIHRLGINVRTRRLSIWHGTSDAAVSTIPTGYATASNATATGDATAVSATIHGMATWLPTICGWWLCSGVSAVPTRYATAIAAFDTDGVCSTAGVYTAARSKVLGSISSNGQYRCTAD